jgi:hypothetical protein
MVPPGHVCQRVARPFTPLSHAEEREGEASSGSAPFRSPFVGEGAGE